MSDYILNNRLEILNKYSSPELAAYSDRSECNLSFLCDYSFKTIGGGRELKYSKWDHNAIINMSNDDFDVLVRILELTDKLIHKYADMNLAQFFSYFSNDKNEYTWTEVRNT